MGGQKGHSVTHYLIEVSNFILYNQDLKNPQAIMALFVDFSQGFNRVLHSGLIDFIKNECTRLVIKNNDQLLHTKKISH